MLRKLRHSISTSLLATALGTALFAAASGPAAAIPYYGAPDLKLTVDLVTAGSGPNGFDTKVLFKNMYGDSMPAEAATLTSKYGAASVGDFFTLMDFSVADVLRMVKRDNVALPAADSPLSPIKLDRSVVLIGHSPHGNYDVGYMLERLISHKYHHELMMDLNSHFSQERVATFHSILGSVVEDTSQIKS
jgi:hypothetical protein